MPFRIGISGLNAASTDLRVTGNNIANASTTGFKESRAEFADIYARSCCGVAATAAGLGVRTAAVTQQFHQGGIETTNNGLDVAINGQGFFVLNDRGSQVYSRAGEFQVDRNGFVVNSLGANLQVFPPLEPNDGVRFDVGRLQDLRLDSSTVAPEATSEIAISANLDANDDVKPAAGFDPADPGTYNSSTSLTIYDSLGIAHNATLYFSRQPPPDDLTWNVNFTVDGEPAVAPFLEASVQFNADGLIDPANLPLLLNVEDFELDNGAEDLNINIDLSALTQFGSPFAVSRLTQDGYASGNLVNVNIDQSGVAFAQYTNGQSRALGKIALANFENVQGLQKLGDNLWAESFPSGPVRLGEPGTSNFGLLQSSALEASNVDIAEQLVRLITAQRSYQANAQVISTADTVTQTILNIR